MPRHPSYQRPVIAIVSTQRSGIGPLRSLLDSHPDHRAATRLGFLDYESDPASRRLAFTVPNPIREIVLNVEKVADTRFAWMLEEGPSPGERAAPGDLPAISAIGIAAHG